MLAPRPPPLNEFFAQAAKMKSVICAVALLFSSVAPVAHAMGKIDETCPGQTACLEDGTPCAENEFCNFDFGTYGDCEICLLVGHSEGEPCDARGLITGEGLEDCQACCGL